MNAEDRMRMAVSKSMEEMDSRLDKMEDFEDSVDVVLDTSELNGQGIISKTKKELKDMKIGQTIKLISTDPGAVGDIESLCQSLKQALEKTIEEDDKFIFIIRKTTDI